MRHANKTTLKAGVEAALVNLVKEKMKRMCLHFRDRIETVIPANRDYLERRTQEESHN